MKYTIRILLLAAGIMLGSQAYSQGNLLKRVKQKTEKKVENETDEKIDEGLDKIFGKKKDFQSGDAGVQPATQSTEATESAAAVTNAGTADAVSPTGVLSWSKFDFVPGDRVIFEDNLRSEENGEFPSRWDLYSGTAEVAKVDGENVIFLRGGTPGIIPYIENSDKDYLPDVFTIEFDAWFGYQYFKVFFYDRKNQKPESGNSQWNMDVAFNNIRVGSFSSKYPGELAQKRWAHISVAYTNGKFKAYLDDTRLINIPRMEVNPSGFSIYSYHASDQYPIYIKNIRIAEGGVKYYDRVMQDGKIVANGIRFDVGKASIKPESMGVINEVVNLMNEHPELRFSVEGHTDSDGNDEANLDLSKMRAEAVKQAMVTMGIPEERLEATGHGESIPVSDNNSPEGKANNRRVEFVKL